VQQPPAQRIGQALRQQPGRGHGAGRHQQGEVRGAGRERLQQRDDREGLSDARRMQPEQPAGRPRRPLSAPLAEPAGDLLADPGAAAEMQRQQRRRRAGGEAPEGEAGAHGAPRPEQPAGGPSGPEAGLCS
jgi:hypothetical protein